VAPYPLNWDNLERFTLFAGFVLGIAQSMGIRLIWGNDWNRDFNTGDTKFKDYPHFELSKKK
jgi:peptidoglycan L-alanyl-D-glutamate endopeptidase CwlK